MEFQTIEFDSPQVNERGEIIEQRRCTARIFTEDLGGGVGLELAVLPGGSFQMGSPASQGYADERPRHPVFVREFLIGRGEVSQAQWKAVMGKLPPCRFLGDDLPVDRVSWNDGAEFCRRLAKKTGRPYRLPSEAEWEYACRAGSSGPFAFGPTLTTALANYVGEYIYAQEPRGVYRHVSAPAGSYPPNAFGLFDMHGSLWEYCADAWHADYTGAPLDGAAWDDHRAVFRVARGGSWHEPPTNCRSAARLKVNPNDREDLFGFRVALTTN